MTNARKNYLLLDWILHAVLTYNAKNLTSIRLNFLSSKAWNSQESRRVARSLIHQRFQHFVWKDDIRRLLHIRRGMLTPPLQLIIKSAKEVSHLYVLRFRIRFRDSMCIHLYWCTCVSYTSTCPFVEALWKMRTHGHIDSRCQEFDCHMPQLFAFQGLQYLGVPPRRLVSSPRARPTLCWKRWHTQAFGYSSRYAYAIALAHHKEC